MDILILEDDCYRLNFFVDWIGQHRLKITESTFCAIDYLKEFTFSYIFLDNDLGEGNGQGIDVAKFLNYNPTNINNDAIIIVHSWNMPASRTIKSFLPKAILIPFNSEKFLNLKLDI